MKRSVPILLYHHISPDREITSQAFEMQMRHLLDQGYECLSMSDLVKVTRGEKAVTRPSFVLTFDDGYADNAEHAFPIIKKLSLKATIYLVTECIGKEGFLTWEQIKDMKASGLVTFGSHTETHRHFIRRESYQNIQDELSKSKSAIESQLGAPCDHLAWPWGDYETEWLPLVKNLGYTSTVTTLAGANTEGSDPFELRRINIRRPGVEWLAARLRWNDYAVLAAAFGWFYGWDRRFKVWWNNESPYSHG